ncbi:MAG: hypothetical protein U1C73_15555 [Dietzia sp.]|nr:hypothetical protein [Dietzia sp.]
MSYDIVNPDNNRTVTTFDDEQSATNFARGTGFDVVPVRSI